MDDTRSVKRKRLLVPTSTGPESGGLWVSDHPRCRSLNSEDERFMSHDDHRESFPWNQDPPGPSEESFFFSSLSSLPPFPLTHSPRRTRLASPSRTTRPLTTHRGFLTPSVPHVWPSTLTLCPPVWTSGVRHSIRTFRLERRFTKIRVIYCISLRTESFQSTSPVIPTTN